MNRKKSMTLAEHNALMENDQTFKEMIRSKQISVTENAHLFRKDISPLASDLSKIGWNIKGSWDLIGKVTQYPGSLSIILEHLHRPYLDRNREAIARSLAVPEAAYAWSSIKREYLAAFPDSCFKNGLAVALSAIVTERTIDELVDMVYDDKNGSSRVLLLEGLRSSNSCVAQQALLDLSSNPVFEKELRTWKK